MSEQIIKGLAQQRIIRRKVVEDKTGLSRSSIYLFISKGKFPAPISLGAKAVGWVESDVDKWISQRIAGGWKAVAV